MWIGAESELIVLFSYLFNLNQIYLLYLMN